MERRSYKFGGKEFSAGDRAVGLVTKGILLFMFFHVLAEFIDLCF
jgi:hypothetical protein